MKYVRIITVILIFAILVPIPSMAVAENSLNEDIIYFNDGSYITIQTTIIDARSPETRNASRTYVYHNLWGNEDWRVTLNATFTYDGSTAKCTIANITVDITNSSWYTVSRSASRDGNTGSCTVVMGYKVLGITTDTKTVNLTLTCDKDGNIS